MWSEVSLMRREVKVPGLVFVKIQVQSKLLGIWCMCRAAWEMVLGIIAFQRRQVLEPESRLKYTPGDEVSVVDSMIHYKRAFVAVRNDYVKPQHSYFPVKHAYGGLGNLNLSMGHVGGNNCEKAKCSVKQKNILSTEQLPFGSEAVLSGFNASCNSIKAVTSPQPPGLE